MRKSRRTSQHGTQNVKTHNRTTQKKQEDEQHGPHQKHQQQKSFNGLIKQNDVNDNHC